MTFPCYSTQTQQLRCHTQADVCLAPPLLPAAADGAQCRWFSYFVIQPFDFPLSIGPQCPYPTAAAATKKMFFLLSSLSLPLSFSLVCVCVCLTIDFSSSCVLTFPPPPPPLPTPFDAAADAQSCSSIHRHKKSCESSFIQLLLLLLLLLSFTVPMYKNSFCSLSLSLTSIDYCLRVFVPLDFPRRPIHSINSPLPSS